MSKVRLIAANGNFQRITHQTPSPVANRRIAWAVAAALLAIAAVGLFRSLSGARNTRKEIAVATSPFSRPRIPTTGGIASMGALQLEGVYRETVRFAIAADAPVIVGTGQAEPIKLGSEVPYSQGGDTLHIWDWSKSPQSRVMKNTRLWPQDVLQHLSHGQTWKLDDFNKK